MKIECVILDWAGTTIDYGCFAPVKAFMETFKEYGIEVTMEETRKPMGMLKWDHIKTMLEMPRIHTLWRNTYKREVSHQDVDKMHELFTTKLMRILEHFTDIKPYVKECVNDIRMMGIKIGSTTGYSDQMMEVVSKGARRNGYAPDCWVSPTSVRNHGRPYPYMIFRNMEILEIKNIRSIIKVGDTISDIQEASCANVISVGILEGSSLIGL
ncbi:MAG: phosphonoacetaldehyde hydrolase, partial [Anaerorhabdus sp.]